MKKISIPTLIHQSELKTQPENSSEKISRSRTLRYSALVFFLVLLVLDASAAKRYWISGSAAKWNNTANWSATSGGAGGASVPGSNDTAFFNGSGTGNDTIDVNVNIKRLDMASGYTGKIVQGSFTVTIGTTGATLAAGTFEGGSGNITISGTTTISATAFTSTSGTLSSSANFTLSGTGSFTHNNGKLKFTASNTITGSMNLYQLEFAPSSASTYVIASGTILTVTNTLTLSGSVGITLNTGAIYAQGDITITNTASVSGGNATLTINGTGTQNFSGAASTNNGRLPNVVINKSSGTLNLSNNIVVTGNWTYTTGTISAGSSTVQMATGKTITGKHTLNNVIFSSGGTFTITSGDTLTVTGTLTIQSATAITINTGVINAKGDITVTNSDNTGGGNATIYISGTGNQTLTGEGTLGNGRLPHITINKSSGTLYLASVISVNGNWTWTSGTIDAGTSTVAMLGSKTISGTHALYNVEIGSSATITITSTDTLTVLGYLNLRGTLAININSGTIWAKGDVTSQNTATSGGGTGTIVINGTANQTLTGSGVSGQGCFPKITIDKPGANRLDLASVISVAGNWTYIRGEVKPNTSAVITYGTINLDGENSGVTMSFYDLATGSGTTTLTGNIDADRNLAIATGTTLSAGSYTINVGGNFTNSGTWTYSTSTVVFDGSNNYKQISGTGGTTVNFYNVTFNKTGTSSITLARPVKINNAMTLTKGRIKTTSTNFLEFPDNATCTGGGVAAYVHGPIRKTGNDAFTFPLGDTTLTDSAAFHPLAITAPSVNTDQFEATYFAAGQTVGDSLVDSLAAVSAEEYWTLERKAGTSNVYARVGWNRNSDINNVGSLRLAGWNGVKWLDYGRADFSINWPTGIVGSSTPITFPANPIYITIGTSKPTYYGYGTMKRKPDGSFYETKGKSLYFRFEDEYNDQNHHLAYKILDETNSNVAPTLIYNSNNDPLSYYGDNRFKLDLYTSSGALHDGYYMLEVTNEKEEKFYLRFHIN